MAVRTIPTAVAASMGGQTYGQAVYTIQETSEPTGASAVRVLGPSRWVMGLRSQQGLSLLNAGEWESMLLRLRGGINHLAVYDFLRQEPLGTVRGDPTISADLAVGATTATLQYIRAVNNLLTEPAVLNGSTWIANNGLSVTANTHARPNGPTLAADTLTDANAAASSFADQVVTVANDSEAHTGSVYVRKTSGGTAPTVELSLFLTGGTTANSVLRVNTDTGAILSGTGVSVLSNDGLYWRIGTTITNNSTGNTSLELRIFPARGPYGVGTVDVTTTGSAVFWGAQLETGSTVTAYDASLTLLPGDWLQFGAGVGSHLCKVVLDAESDNTNTIAITFEPPVRQLIAAGTSVVWYRPKGHYKMRNEALSWSARANGPAIDGFSVDLIEDWGT
jgi:hypothetical protein